PNDNLNVRRFRAILKDDSLCLAAQSATQIWTKQKLRFRFSLARAFKQLPFCYEFRREVPFEVELGPHGIDGSGVRGAEFQLHLRAVGGASFYEYACRCALPNFPDKFWPSRNGRKFIVAGHRYSQLADGWVDNTPSSPCRSFCLLPESSAIGSPSR